MNCTCVNIGAISHKSRNEYRGSAKGSARCLFSGTPRPWTKEVYVLQTLTLWIRVWNISFKQLYRMLSKWQYPVWRVTFSWTVCWLSSLMCYFDEKSIRYSCWYICLFFSGQNVITLFNALDYDWTHVWGHWIFHKSMGVKCQMNDQYMERMQWNIFT